MFKVFFLLAFAATTLAMAADDSISATVNYDRLYTGPDRVEFSGIRLWNVTDFSLAAKVRLGTSDRQLQNLDWAAEVTHTILNYIKPSLRFYNASQLATGTHHTGLYPALNAESPLLFSFLKIRGNFGMYLRWVTLSNSTPLPFWGGTSYFEYDFGFSLGGDFLISPLWRVSGFAGTYDEFDVHNFNNPLWKVEVGHQLSDTTELAVFFRNDFLLGFGRSHSWRLGATYAWKL